MTLFGFQQKKPEAEESLIKKKMPRGYHSELAEGSLYMHQCAEIKVKFAEISFCKEEVPAEVRNLSSESHIRFMDPISRIIYRKYDLTLCNKVYPNAFELGNGSGYHKQNN